MPIDDNVVKMPDRLDAHAKAINVALEKRDNSICDWVEANLAIAERLTQAREALPNNADFGSWCDKWFGNCMNKNARAIYVQWGKKIEWTRIVLEKTERKSIELIHEKEWTLPNTRNSPDNPKAPGGPKLREAKDKILAYEAVEGKLPPADRHFEMPGIKPSTYDRAIREVRGARAEAETLGPLKFTKATAVHIESILARRMRELEDAFSDRVRKAVQRLYDENFPTLEREKLEAFQQKRDYEKLFNNHEHIFTMAEYNDLLLCTHEANPSAETRKRAFMALNARKFQLTGKK